MQNLNLLENLPSGPLDKYRKSTSFDWKVMRLFFETPELLEVKTKIWNILKKDPVFQRDSGDVTADEAQKMTAIRLWKFLDYQFISPSILERSYKDLARHALNVNLSIATVFPDVGVKYGIGVLSFLNILVTLGTERHRTIKQAVFKKKIVASLSLTEISHGSNIRALQTTATYIKESQEFLINSPDFKAAKCWIGNLAKTCTMTAIFAQLYIDDECYGVHVFIVPLRDPKTFQLYPGIIIGNMGEKIGLHGVDNGFVIFKNYKIPRQNLLNRFSDVTPEGKYVNSSIEPEKILAISLLNVSAGRIFLMQCCTEYFINAITIAIRYAALRKQFSNGNNDEEIALIEYPLHQHRLFPYVAAAAAFKVFLMNFIETYYEQVQKSVIVSEVANVKSSEVSEMHAIVSSCKPLITRTAFDAVQESREACGGHGFLKSSGFGDMREYADASLTFEGDNNVLGQQTSNWLLYQWNSVVQEKVQPTFLIGTCQFFTNHEEILGGKIGGLRTDNVLKQEFITRCYEWLIIYLVKEISQKQAELLKKDFNKIETRNFCQVYGAPILTKVYGEYVILKYFWSKLRTVEGMLYPVLERLGLLYGLWSLTKHMVYFYCGGYATDKSFSTCLNDAVVHLCTDLKKDVVVVVDALAPPDFILNSVIGRANGKLYENLEQFLLKRPVEINTSEWLRNVVTENDSDFTKARSKL